MPNISIDKVCDPASGHDPLSQHQSLAACLADHFTCSRQGPLVDCRPLAFFGSPEGFSNSLQESPRTVRHLDNLQAYIVFFQLVVLAPVPAHAEKYVFQASPHGVLAHGRYKRLRRRQGRIKLSTRKTLPHI